MSARTKQVGFKREARSREERLMRFCPEASIWQRDGNVSFSMKFDGFRHVSTIWGFSVGIVFDVALNDYSMLIAPNRIHDSSLLSVQVELFFDKRSRVTWHGSQLTNLAKFSLSLICIGSCYVLLKEAAWVFREWQSWTQLEKGSWFIMTMSCVQTCRNQNGFNISKQTITLRK